MRDVDLNSDLGESFGSYKIGADEAMLDLITSANVACGFHGGDASVMHQTAASALKRGIDVGAHPGFNDLWGFGRRKIVGDSPQAIGDMLAYQIAAMQGMARAAGHRVTHVKVHGALSSNDGDIALGWVLDGHGIMIRSEWDLAKYLESGRLRVVLPDFTLPSADLFVYYPQRRNQTARARAFIDFLVQAFLPAGDQPTPAPGKK